MASDRMQVQRAVRLVAVQVDRDRRDRDVRQHQRGEDQLPPGELQQTTVQKIKKYMHLLSAANQSSAGSTRWRT